MVRRWRCTERPAARAGRSRRAAPLRQRRNSAMRAAVRKYAVFLLALTAISCDKPQAATPQGPAGDVAREIVALLAPNAKVVDQPFEDAIGRIDFAKAYGARG